MRARQPTLRGRKRRRAHSGDAGVRRAWSAPASARNHGTRSAYAARADARKTLRPRSRLRLLRRPQYCRVEGPATAD